MCLSDNMTMFHTNMNLFHFQNSWAIKIQINISRISLCIICFQMMVTYGYYDGLSLIFMIYITKIQFLSSKR
jgi:hypothetical protein